LGLRQLCLLSQNAYSMFRLMFYVTILFACSPAVKKTQPYLTTSKEDKPLAENPLSQTQNIGTIQNLYLPQTLTGETVVHHFAYDLVYSEPHEQAKWVAYELTQNESISLYKRNNHFTTDPEIATGSATDADYSGYNFDRGHLAPAADMCWSSVAMKESFYYSNMSPQVAAFNRGVWKRLETQVRTWAVLDSAINIVTGPVLTNNLLSIGPNNVSVPTHYYKVVLEHNGSNKKGLGFVLPNAGSDLPLRAFAVSIDSVERLTGIDFFHKLPDHEENVIEATVCLDCWNWGVGKAGTSGQKKESSSVQCKGYTKTRLRCKRMTLSPNGYCHQHGGN
jgi:endonuclease G